MKDCNVTHKPISIKDYKDFYGEERPQKTINGYSFFKGDELIAICGVQKNEDGVYIAFSDIKNNVTLNKITIWRNALKVMSFIDKIKIPVFAIPENDSSRSFLERLGFIAVNDSYYFRGVK